VRGSSSRKKGIPAFTALVAAFGWTCLELMELFISGIAPYVKTDVREENAVPDEVHPYLQRNGMVASFS